MPTMTLSVIKGRATSTPARARVVSGAAGHIHGGDEHAPLAS